VTSKQARDPPDDAMACELERRAWMPARELTPVPRALRERDDKPARDIVHARDRDHDELGRCHTIARDGLEDTLRLGPAEVDADALHQRDDSVEVAIADHVVHDAIGHGAPVVAAWLPLRQHRLESPSW
jgi:hypothetical protein